MYKRYGLFLLFLFVWGAAVPGMAAALEPSTDSQVYTLGEVVVSASDIDKDVSTSVEVTADDIEARNATTLDRALELLPGVDVTTGGRGTPRINIHGFKSRHVVFLLNGIPMNAASDGQFNPNLIPTENIAKIKLSYGTHSVLYGQGGLAGVINVITKKGTKGFGLNASSQIDERGNHVTKATASGGKDRFDYFLSMSNSDSDGYRLAHDFDTTSEEDGGLRENSDNERLTFFGNLGVDLSDDFSAGLTLSHTDGEYGIPSSVINDKKDVFAKNVKYERVDDLEAFSSQLSLDYHPEGILGMRAWAFVNSLDEDNNQYEDETFSDLSSSTTDETDIQGGTIQASLDFSEYGKTIFSLSAEKDQYTSNGWEVNKKGKKSDISLDRELELYTAALEYRLSLFSKLNMTAGINHTWQNRDDAEDKDKSGYMIGAGFDLTDKTRLRASYARKIRFPTISQLYEDGAGTSSLKPETSDNYEAGITQDLGMNISMDLSAFVANVENYIEKDDVSGYYENHDEYQFKGIDFTLKRPFAGNKGVVSLGYCLLKSKDKSPGTLKDELQYRPEHKFTLAGTYKFDFGLMVHADIMYVADQYYYGKNDTSYKGELNDYTIVNLNLEQKIYKDTVSVYAGALNLFDQDYEESYALPRAGRTAYAGVKVRF